MAVSREWEETVKEATELAIHELKEAKHHAQKAQKHLEKTLPYTHKYYCVRSLVKIISQTIDELKE